MFYRKDVVLMAVAGLLASSGYAMAESKSGISLDPKVIAADDASAAPLMALLGKAGLDKPLNDAKINIYGWVEAGYTYNHRHGSGSASVPIVPGPFNHEVGNHLMLNQVDLRFERAVDTKKFDIGGLVELLYGTDSNAIHSRGLSYGNGGSDDRYNPQFQFDIPQAYLTVNLPVGNGLQLMIGKFVTLMGTETIDPRGNALYSHSYLFSAIPFTHTGVLGSYQLNDQLGVKLGVTRGWDVALEDNNDTIDVIGQVSYVFNKQISALFNFTVGPENLQDNGHYRVAVNPILTWQVTDALKISAEGLYVYDGGLNQEENGSTHAYGDVWGTALYASYKINDMFTINGRAEAYHNYSDASSDLSDLIPNFDESSGRVPSICIYEATLGVSITPCPKDPWLKGLMLRPEIRYDWSASRIYPTNNNVFKDQLTFGCDLIFQF